MQVVDGIGQLLEIFPGEVLVQFLLSNHFPEFPTLCELQDNVDVVRGEDVILQSNDVGVIH